MPHHLDEFTYSQRGGWFVEYIRPRIPVLNEECLVRNGVSDGPLDADRLFFTPCGSAFEELSDRNQRRIGFPACHDSGLGGQSGRAERKKYRHEAYPGDPETDGPRRNGRLLG